MFCFCKVVAAYVVRMCVYVVYMWCMWCYEYVVCVWEVLRVLRYANVLRCGILAQCVLRGCREKKLYM